MAKAWLAVFTHLLGLDESPMLFLSLEVFFPPNSAIMLPNWPGKFYPNPCPAVWIKVLRSKQCDNIRGDAGQLALVLAQRTVVPMKRILPL